MYKKRLVVALIGGFICVAVSGCGLQPTPSGLGEKAGKYFGKAWIDKFGKGSLPATNVAAKYCTDTEADYEKKYSWNFTQASEYTDACVNSLGDALGLKR